MKADTSSLSVKNISFLLTAFLAILPLENDEYFVIFWYFNQNVGAWSLIISILTYLPIFNLVPVFFEQILKLNIIICKWNLFSFSISSFSRCIATKLRGMSLWPSLKLATVKCGQETDRDCEYNVALYADMRVGHILLCLISHVRTQLARRGTQSAYNMIQCCKIMFLQAHEYINSSQTPHCVCSRWQLHWKIYFSCFILSWLLFARRLWLSGLV